MIAHIRQSMAFVVPAALIVWSGGMSACRTGSARHEATSVAPAEDIIPTGFGPSVDRDVARARAATAAFVDLDRAVAAGYAGRGARCVDHPPAGGMGFHHLKAGLQDATLEVEQPEILTYRTAPDGRYQLTGVEYVVPFSAWRAGEPPTLFGQALKPSPALGIWYLHAWIWLPNPNGLFADWNPAVTCSAEQGAHR